MEVITTHTNGDFDTLASMIAAKKLYPGAITVFPAGVEKSVREFLHNYPIPDFKQVKPNKVNMNDVDRLILVDTRQKGRIGAFASIIGKEGLDIHIYDHHPSSDDDISGSLEITEKYGSTTTIMVQVLRKKGFTLSPEEATVLMLGIYEDTGFLSFISTRPEDYQAAAYLLSAGADLRIVSDTIRREMSAEEVALLNELNSTALTHRIAGADIVITRASAEKYVGDAAALVHKMMEMMTIDVLFALIRMDSKIYLIARSRVREVNVGEIASKLGGGGHPTAASATIKKLTLIEAEDNLLKILKDEVREIRCAADIMSSPVKTVEVNDSLEATKEIMAKLNLNVLPVMEKGKLAGLVSRQDIGKALYHGLAGHELSEIMTSDFSTVSAKAPLSKVQELIIDGNQRFLPVIDNESINGCITRTDILRILHDESKRLYHKTDREVQRRNLKGILKGRLPLWIQEILQKAGQVADESAINAYLVGGFVRDLLMGRENLDIDIVVEGNGIDYAESLAGALGGRVKSHAKFGTAVVVLKDGFKLDIASARMEYYQRPAALPTVEAASIKMDLYRRDFTINSMAIRLNKSNAGELIDYFGGLRDLKEKVIRVLHSLSFIEDPTRAFRAVRFEVRLGFHLGKQTLSLIKSAARLDFFDKVSSSRIFNELKIIIREKEPLWALKRMEALDIMRFIHPKIKIGSDTEELFGEIKKVTDWYDLLFKKKGYELWILYLSAMLKNLNTNEVAGMLKNIGIASKFGDKIIEIKKKSAKNTSLLSKRKIDDLTLFHTLMHQQVETLLFMMAHSKDVKIRERISLFIRDLQETSIETTGQEIMKLGLKPGPLFKEIKETLVDEKLKGNIKSRSDEINYIKKTWLQESRKAYPT
ncbi:MAG: CBS domain-containing protein [Deltaproteobacteria bacterium]|nr:CBS domain-containing protein [Deltaproteobacteria bacterium]